MSVSTPFINRPVATTLLTFAMTLAGAIAYTQLPVSPIPQVDFPTIFVSGHATDPHRPTRLSVPAGRRNQPQRTG